MTIGITCSHHKNELTESRKQKLDHYGLALQDAGAQSKVLFLPDISTVDLKAVAAKYASDLQGVIISGGADLPPGMFGADADPNLGELIPPLRPAFEKELVHLMLNAGKPVLGICYGVQLLNVLEGGSLVQDIASRYPDAIEHREGARHDVHTEPGTRLREWLGESFEVASYHHQSIEKVAPTARLAALASDGIIEAVEFPIYRFCIGVQWHPERMRESEATQKLMRTFVDACR